MTLRKSIIMALLLWWLGAAAFGGTVFIDPYRFVNTPSPTPAGPVLVSANVDISGLVLTMIFNVAITDSDWSSTVTNTFTCSNDDDAGVDYASGDGTNTILLAVHHGPIREGSNVTLSYSGTTIQNLAGTLLATFTDVPVINSSKE